MRKLHQPTNSYVTACTFNQLQRLYRNRLITPRGEDSCQGLLAEIEDRHQLLVATDPAAIYFTRHAQRPSLRYLGWIDDR